VNAARERMLAVLALLAIGGLAVLCSTQTWATLRLHTGDPISVAGQSASPALTSIGIVLLALAGALAIAGAIVRIVLGVVAALLGAAIVAISLPTALDPTVGGNASVTKQTGVAGSVGIRQLIASASGTAWPVIAVVAGAAGIAVGVALVLRAGRWPSAGRRYRSGPRVVPVTGDPIDTWDSLTAGADPTGALDAAARPEATDATTRPGTE
jgi:Tryptophan-associated transmembrane protein (Trp_oprn_chp)